MPKQTSAWLEPVLTRELCRVPAPPELWDWVQLPSNLRFRTPRRAVSIWFAYASAAGLLLVSAVGLHSYLKSEVMLTARSTGVVHLQAACHLCHSGDELQAVVLRGVY